MSSNPVKDQAVLTEKERDEALLEYARSLSWIFIIEGEFQPMVITYNSVMWPAAITVKEKVNLEKKPYRTKMILNYQGKQICCLLIEVIATVLLDSAKLDVEKHVDAISSLGLENQQPSTSLMATVTQDDAATFKGNHYREL